MTRTGRGVSKGRSGVGTAGKQQQDEELDKSRRSWLKAERSRS